MGKLYIFGYGSLASKASTAATLGREPLYFETALLEGWVRDWNLSLLNRSKESYFMRTDSGDIPQFAAALNVRLPHLDENATNPNGVLFDITEAELARMDAREEHYKRIDVTQYIHGAPEGIIYTYTGLSHFCDLPDPEEIFLPKSYLELVESGFQSFGTAYLEEFRKTTIEPTLSVKPSVFILRPMTDVMPQLSPA